MTKRALTDAEKALDAHARSRIWHAAKADKATRKAADVSPIARTESRSGSPSKTAKVQPRHGRLTLVPSFDGRTHPRAK